MFGPVLAAFALLMQHLPAGSAGAANLWPGEQLRQAAGFPFVVKLLKSEAKAPLVVFMPGQWSTARVAYGGHEGGRAEDFLAHWLNQQGYNFLGISYPIRTKGGLFDKVHPDFTGQAWGRGAAELTQAVMRESGITGPVIMAGWSMAGKSVQPYAAAAKAIGLDLDFVVSLSASAAIPGILEMDKPVKLTEDKLLMLPPRGAAFVTKQIAPPDGRTIIPMQVIGADCFGHTPVQLIGRGWRYDSAAKTVSRDHWAEMQDTQFFDQASFPLVASVVPGKGDARHTLTDQFVWGFYNAFRSIACGRAERKRSAA